jgi:hypothetical protein
MPERTGFLSKAFFRFSIETTFSMCYLPFIGGIRKNNDGFSGLLHSGALQ